MISKKLFGKPGNTSIIKQMQTIEKRDSCDFLCFFKFMSVKAVIGMINYIRFHLKGYLLTGKPQGPT